MKKALIFLLSLFLIINLTNAQYQLMWVNSTFYVLNQQGFNCLKYFEMGTKFIFWQSRYHPFSSNLSEVINLINSTKFNNHSNHIIMYYDYTNVTRDFVQYVDPYFNQTIVDTIWLQPKNSNTSYNCDAARTAMYECISRKMKCGFYFNETSYATLMKNEKCSQLSSFPLFYQGIGSDFTQFGGWIKYKYAKGNQPSNLCQLNIGSVDKVTQFLKTDQNQEIKQNIREKSKQVINILKEMSKFRR